MDVVFIIAEEGSIFAAWRSNAQAVGASRIPQWFKLWQAEIDAFAG